MNIFYLPMYTHNLSFIQQIILNKAALPMYLAQMKAVIIYQNIRIKLNAA